MLRSSSCLDRNHFGSKVSGDICHFQSLGGASQNSQQPTYHGFLVSRRNLSFARPPAKFAFPLRNRGQTKAGDDDMMMRQRTYTAEKKVAARTDVTNPFNAALVSLPIVDSLDSKLFHERNLIPHFVITTKFSCVKENYISPETLFRLFRVVVFTTTRITKNCR